MTDRKLPYHFTTQYQPIGNRIAVHGVLTTEMSRAELIALVGYLRLELNAAKATLSAVPLLPLSLSDLPSPKVSA